MTKAELVDKVARDACITKKAAELALASVTAGVRDSLKKGKKVTLVGFGTFSVARRAARNGRNPQTGDVIKIKAATIPRFRAGKALKDAVELDVFEVYTRFFHHLYTHNITIQDKLGLEVTGFVRLLRRQPSLDSEQLDSEYKKYLRELIQYGMESPAIKPYCFEFFEDRGMLRQTTQGPRFSLNPKPATLRLSVNDVNQIRESLFAASQLAEAIERNVTGLPPTPSTPVTEGSPASGSGHSKRAKPPAREEPMSVLDVGRTSGGATEREITVTGHTLDGQAATRFEPHQAYRLRFRVGSPSSVNLATGDISVGNIPPGGLKTHWVVTSTEVEFLPHLSTANVTKFGASWVAEFDLLIPESGESVHEELGVLIGASAAKILLTLYAVCAADNTSEIYRQLTVDLAGLPIIKSDTTVVAPSHTNLRTTHEWMTPIEHVEISVQNGSAKVSTHRGLNDHNFRDSWTGTDNRLPGAIQNVRNSLERFRAKWEKYLNDVDPADMTDRLSDPGKWQPYCDKGNGWQSLPDEADTSHRTAFDQVQQSVEWRNLAHDGFTLYESCFPYGSRLRSLIDNLKPGSRIDFDWTSESGPGWISHVPWTLMHMDPLDATLPDPERFLGLRFRIGSRAWPTQVPSRALGGLDDAHSLHLLYWGDRPGDEVADESRWQLAEYRNWRHLRLLPDLTSSNLSQLEPKKQIVVALDTPMPAPVALVYFYCHCSVGDGSQPVLRFGNTSQPQDILIRAELPQRRIPDAPLIFANACTTVQADPHMTGELEDSFFRRGVRAFIGTETKVPIQLASKFAWLFFRFFYRIVDPEPMAAGESLTQSRIFLWTQYKNVGGLFYSLVNQYDLYFASNKEVSALRR